MAVQFATDPGTDVFLRGLDAGERARRARTQVAVDAAIRRGLAADAGGMGTQQPPAAPTLAPPITPPGQQQPAAPAPRAAAPSLPTPPIPPGDPSQVGVSGGVPDSVPAGAEPGSIQIPAPAAPAPRPSATLAPMLGRQQPAAAPSPALAPPMQPQGGGGGDRYGGVIRELAGVEGGGAAALGVMQQQDRASMLQDRRRDALARMSMYALRQGDVATGQYFAQQAGIPLPQVALGHGRGGGRGGQTQSQMFGRAALDAKRLYGNDPQQAHRYVTAFVQNGGDIGAALEAAGPPSTGPVRQFRWVQHADGGEALVGIRPDGSSLLLSDDEGQPYRRQPTMRVVPTQGGYASVNPQDGSAQPVMGPDGQPIQRQQPGVGGAAGRGGRPLDREVRRQMLIDAGIDPQTAALMAGGGVLTPGQRSNIYMRVQSAVMGDVMIPPDKKQAEIQRRTDTIFQQFGGSVPTLAPPIGGAGGAGYPRAQQDAPAPAAPPQAQGGAAPQGVPPPAQRQPGMIYPTPRGNLRWTGTGWVQP